MEAIHLLMGFQDTTDWFWGLAAYKPNEGQMCIAFTFYDSDRLVGVTKSISPMIFSRDF